MFQEYYKFEFQSMKSTHESRKCYFMHDFHLFEGLIHAFQIFFFFKFERTPNKCLSHEKNLDNGGIRIQFPDAKLSLFLVLG